MKETVAFRKVHKIGESEEVPEKSAHKAAGERYARSLFIYGFIIGLTAFIAVYGLKVLDVTKDGWIFKSDIDLRQHYLGWMAYRMSPWSFPLGMTDRLSYPHPMSVVFTDSIPLAALFFKLVSSLLPGNFQYFGLYGLLNFALTGAFGAVTLGRLTKRRVIAAVMTVPLVLSFPMLQRTFYHTALASQWLILWAFDLWLSGRLYQKGLKIWLLFGLLCGGIHLYFLPITACIFCGAYLEKQFKEKGKEIFRCIPCVMVMCAASAFVLWIFGAFSVKSSGDYWIGDFTMNLSSLINSMGHSILLPELPLYTQMQFEGAIYPGLGMLVLMTAALFIVSAFVIMKKVKPEEVFSFKKHPRCASIMIVFLIFAAAAVLPVAAFSDVLIFKIPYPKWLSSFLGIFRSNGRFAWGCLYILIFSLVRFLDILPELMKTVKDKWRGKKGINPGYPLALMLTLVCVLVNIIDFMPWMGERHGKYLDPPDHYFTVWDEAGLPDKYRGFITFEKDNTFNMGTAYYAMNKGMTLNSFYFARNIDDLTEDTLDGYYEKLKTGQADPEYVYVLDKDTWEALKDTSGLYFYPTRKCAFAVAEPIQGMEQLTESTALDIHWR